MKKRIFILMTVTFATSIALVLGLYALSSHRQQIRGTFMRLYPPHPVVEELAMPLAYDSYYLAGATYNRVYLGHRRSPRHVLSIDRNLQDTVHVTLTIDDLDKHKNFRVDVRIDSPYFYFMDGTVPYLYRGTIGHWKGRNILTDSTYYLDAIPMSPSSAALGAYSPANRENELFKKTFSQPGARLNSDLLQKQIDGSFCVEGKLAYNRYLNQLIYVYRYRNEYFVMDTTLQLQYREHTLDTFSRARVVFDTVHATGAVQLAAPPPIVNRMFATFRQWLFIQSKVPAKNEYDKQFENGSVIDVYDLREGAYRFSFYINDTNDTKLKDFLVADYTLYALFDHTLKRYALPERSFPRERNDETKPVSQE